MLDHHADCVKLGPMSVRLVPLSGRHLHELQSLAAARTPGVVVVRSLTKLWSIPGVRAGYVLADEHVQNAVRSRTPFVLGAPNCPAAKCIEKLAMRLEQGVSNAADNSGFFNRMSRWFRR